MLPQQEDDPVMGRLMTGLPPVLPSLSKPDKSTAGVQLNPTPSAVGLPPVTTLTPTPEEQRVSQVRSKLDKLQNTPSATQGLWDRTKGADTTLGKIGHVGAGVLRGVDIAAESLFPKIAANIPGSIAHTNQNVMAARKELGEAETQAAGARKSPETQAFEGDRAAGKTPMQAFTDVEAAKRPPQKPDKPEDLQQNYADAVAAAQAAGRDPATDPAVQQWADAITAIQKQTPQKPTLDKKIDSYIAKDGRRMEVMQKSDNTTYVQPETPTREPSASSGAPMMVDSTGHIFKPTVGGKLPEGAQTVSGVGGANTKQTQAGNAAVEAVSYASAYANQPPTGPGDEALMERFFEVAKPTSGFRMTQQQMDMLMHARSWMDSGEAKVRHATEGTYFSADQRKQILNTMSTLQQARGEGKGFGAERMPQAAGGKQPDQLQKEGWTWRDGKQGWGWYK